MQFIKAERKNVRLRLALTSPSGCGKTYGALTIAKGLGGRTALLDTQWQQANVYADEFEFFSLPLYPPYSPERFIEAIDIAEKAGFDNLIIDTWSHEWNGPGGCLEINDALAIEKYKGNTWMAWNETTPRHRKVVDKVLSSPLHIIVTMRSKTETVMNEQKKVIKLGLKSEQRDGMDYEFTTVLAIQYQTHLAEATKDHTGLFKKPVMITEDTGKKLAQWLSSGSIDPKQRATALVKSLVVEMTRAIDLNSLQHAYIAAKAAAEDYTDLRTMVYEVKEDCKAALIASTDKNIETPQSQDVPETSHQQILSMIDLSENVAELAQAESQFQNVLPIYLNLLKTAADDKRKGFDIQNLELIEPDQPTPPMEESDFPVKSDLADEETVIAFPTRTQGKFTSDLLQAKSTPEVDRLIYEIEKHPVESERKALLVLANQKRNDLIAKSESNALSFTPSVPPPIDKLNSCQSRHAEELLARRR